MKNKYFYHALCVGGVRGTLQSKSKNLFNFEMNRCQAPSRNLDQDGFVLNRTRKLDATLIERVMANVLWDEYGIAGDLIVSYTH